MNDLTTATEANWREWTRNEYQGQWQPPAITPAMQQQAAAVLVNFTDRFIPAQISSARRWLDSLGMFVVGKTTVEDLSARIEAYAGIACKYPRGVFTKSSLERAAEKFKFWPSYAEIREFLDDEKKRIYLDQHRLQVIVNHQPRQKTQEIDRSPEAVARWDAAMADFMKGMGKSWKK